MITAVTLNISRQVCQNPFVRRNSDDLRQKDCYRNSCY